MRKLVIGLSISAAVVGGFVIAQFMGSSSAAPQPVESVKQITEQEAKEIALKEVNGTITGVDFDQDELRPHYEFEIQTNNHEVDVEVDAKTGKATITDRDKAEKVPAVNNNQAQNQAQSQTQSQTQNSDTAATSQENSTVKATNNQTTASAAKEVITKAEAIKIASTVAKGTVTKAELDSDDDSQTKKYELEFKDGNVEYDVEVDAYTGKILEVNQDLED